MAYREILEGVDQHTENVAALGIPGSPKDARRVAKIFLFRIIYGGTIFHKDALFRAVSTKKKFWDDRVESFYEKYEGLKRWHDHLVRTATLTGGWTNPTGRRYTYTRERGEWPRTKILNYPVQGLAADIMMLARVSFNRRLVASGLPALQIATVHDSILLDTTPESWYNIGMMLEEVFRDLPDNFERMFGVPFDLPLRCKVTYGANKAEEDMKVWQAEAAPQSTPPTT